ncbi:hypothetical protein IMG5_162100 [Ichthyophthirius multifiliis]|uniref:Uncharacterized protein n=1 Tax=Ichthyophthirius multifiliis TaxID=5932 RepID=G0R056_ICHMU|nr:hypothetical protein IMG5_162100 [Ichthyophthirius multifiliis]EGR29155.1 hypothetical protein IMG5_162100 [Ichthyophthirius multifiliis]|eukprot:XP_004030391.1 hypothetical protein IMG5_162100 [Ichthyophthirius multifiliis]
MVVKIRLNGIKVQMQIVFKTEIFVVELMGIHKFIQKNKSVRLLDMNMIDPEANRSFIKVNNFAQVIINNFHVDKYYYPGGLISNYYLHLKKTIFSQEKYDTDVLLQRRTDSILQITIIINIVE